MLSSVQIDASVSDYKEACLVARERANGAEAGMLLSMFDVDYHGQENIAARHGTYVYSFGKNRPGDDGGKEEGYQIDVIMDLRKHLIERMEVTHGDPIAVEAPPYDLSIMDWTMTEEDIFDFIFADVGIGALEEFESPVVTFGGRLADGRPVLIAQCYDEGNYNATLRSYFFDPRTGERIPDAWPAGL